MPTLSVCLVTNASPEQLTVVLERTRSFATEIIIGLDESVDPTLDRSYRRLVDEVIRVPFPGSQDRVQSWLVRQCSGDWVLMLDSDEALAASLAQEISDVIRDPAITHAWMPRRWLYPDAERMINIWPWRPDYQLRLVRNDHALIRFPGRVHLPLTALGPCRYLEHPIYHSDLAVTTYDQRLQKCERYEELYPGLISPIAGTPFNAAYYLPEDRTDLLTIDVPPEDRDATRALIVPPQHPRARRLVRGRWRTATIGDINYWWERRGLEPQDARALLRVLDDPIICYSANECTIDVEVTNLGRMVWRWGSDAVESPIRLVNRWESPDGRNVGTGLRTALPADLGPGESCIVPMRTLPPEEPGPVTLVLDLFFGLEGAFGSDLRASVEVAPRSGSSR